MNLYKGYNPTNRKHIDKDLLDVIHYHNMQRKLSMINKEADMFGFYFSGMVLQYLELNYGTSCFRVKIFL